MYTTVPAILTNRYSIAKIFESFLFNIIYKSVSNVIIKEQHGFELPEYKLIKNHNSQLQTDLKNVNNSVQIKI